MKSCRGTPYNVTQQRSVWSFRRIMGQLPGCRLSAVLCRQAHRTSARTRARFIGTILVLLTLLAGANSLSDYGLQPLVAKDDFEGGTTYL